MYRTVRTMQRVLQRHREEGHVHEREHRGRPQAHDLRATRRICRGALRDRRNSLQHVASELCDGVQISRSTLGRVLKREGYSRLSQCSRPLLTRRQKQQRLQWALTHENWGVCHWSRVVFSDEKIFWSTSDNPSCLVTRKST